MARGARKNTGAASATGTRPGQLRRASMADSATQEDQCHPKKIFVGGLPHETSTQHLHEHFKQYGAIADAVVLRWPDGRSRGFGYVTFANSVGASGALKEVHTFGGQEVDVKRAVPGTNKLFVGGLPQNVTAAELRKHFESFGVVSDAVVMIDTATNRSRGFGFVCFQPGPDGAAAVQASLQAYQGHRIRGKWIEVKSAAPPHKLAESEELANDVPGESMSGARQIPEPQQQQQHQQQQQQQPQKQLAAPLATPAPVAPPPGLALQPATSPRLVETTEEAPACQLNARARSATTASLALGLAAAPPGLSAPPGLESQQFQGFATWAPAAQAAKAVPPPPASSAPTNWTPTLSTSPPPAPGVSAQPAYRGEVGGLGLPSLLSTNFRRDPKQQHQHQQQSLGSATKGGVDAKQQQQQQQQQQHFMAPASTGGMDALKDPMKVHIRPSMAPAAGTATQFGAGSELRQSLQELMRLHSRQQQQPQPWDASEAQKVSLRNGLSSTLPPGLSEGAVHMSF